MKLAILVLEDEPEVRTAIARDLSQFSGGVRVEIAEDVEDAKSVLDEITHDGDLLALIVTDHRMPGTTGVDFLVESQNDPRTKHAYRILLTGQAGHEDTIRAINEGGLVHYIPKPWEAAHLQRVVREQLTNFVLDKGLDPLPVLNVIDSVRAMEALRRRPGGSSV